jgi:osmotically-inducible protein OsmY
VLNSSGEKRVKAEHFMADKDYSTNEKLRQAVLDALKKGLSGKEQLGELEIRVGVLKGVVHLGGSVKSLAAWDKAQEIAAKVPGIRGVVNRIEALGAPAPSRIINLDLLPEKSSLEPSQPREQKENSNEKQS